MCFVKSYNCLWFLSVGTLNFSLRITCKLADPPDSQRKKDERTFTVIGSGAEDRISTSFSMLSQKERRAPQAIPKSQRSRVDLLRSGTQSTSQCVTGRHWNKSSRQQRAAFQYLSCHFASRIFGWTQTVPTVWKTSEKNWDFHKMIQIIHVSRRTKETNHVSHAFK